MARNDGWPGVKRVYRLPHTPRGLDHGLASDAIAAGRVDVMDVYSTDAKIVRYGLRVLEDDRHHFPDYDAVLVYRLEVPERFPEAWAELARLEGRIDQARMTAVNAEAELDGRPFADVARRFLGEGGPAPPRADSLLARLAGPDFWRLTGQHVVLVFGSLAAAIALGVPLGV